MTQTEAQKILEMIEAVDPADTDTLDEIDARVWCWLNRTPTWLSHYRDLEECPSSTTPTVIYDIEHIDGAVEINAHYNLCYSERYTRSRDALKSVRPEGWSPYLRFERGDGGSVIYRFELCNRWGDIVQSAWVESEELAELHAIIQAIE